MNVKQSGKNIGKLYLLVPAPQSLTWTPTPEHIPHEFNTWRFDAVDRKRHIVRFSHSLGYFVELPFNDIVGHENDGRYKLKRQLIIEGPRVHSVAIQRS